MPSKDAVNMVGVHVRVKHSITNKWVREQFNQGQNIVDRVSSEASIIDEVPEGKPIMVMVVNGDSNTDECSMTENTAGHIMTDVVLEDESEHKVR